MTANANTLARQNRRHPDLISIDSGELIRWRALEFQIQADLAPWQRKHVDAPAVPPGNTRTRVGPPRQPGSRPWRWSRRHTEHDHWPTRPR